MNTLITLPLVVVYLIGAFAFGVGWLLREILGVSRECKCGRPSASWLCAWCVEALITEGALEALRAWHATRPQMQWKP